MIEIPINEEEEKMKRHGMSIYTIYSQDIVLESSLEPLEKKQTNKQTFFPSEIKCIIFAHSKPSIKIKLQMLLYMTGTFLPKKGKAALINLQCIYTWR